MGRLESLWQYLISQARKLDSQLILYRAYFLLGSVSLMLVVILLLNVRVQEQTIIITRIVSDERELVATVEYLSTAIIVEQESCNSICATSVAKERTRLAPTRSSPTPMATNTLESQILGPTRADYKSVTDEGD